jgi:hypothetical protein
MEHNLGGGLYAISVCVSGLHSSQTTLVNELVLIHSWSLLAHKLATAMHKDHMLQELCLAIKLSRGTKRCTIEGNIGNIGGVQ